jgi:hypothetical protein
LCLCLLPRGLGAGGTLRCFVGQPPERVWTSRVQPRLLDQEEHDDCHLKVHRWGQGDPDRHEVFGKTVWVTSAEGQHLLGQDWSALGVMDVGEHSRGVCSDGGGCGCPKFRANPLKKNLCAECFHTITGHQGTSPEEQVKQPGRKCWTTDVVQGGRCPSGQRSNAEVSWIRSDGAGQRG